MSSDPRLTLLGRVLGRRRPLTVPRERGVREAAVALVIRPADELELLLIKRAEHESDPWSGHVALPGGRREAADADLLQTAMRETHEETGVVLDRVGAALGALDEVGTRNPQLPRLVIAPFVTAVPPETTAAPVSHEVADVVWVPLPALRDEGAISEIVLELDEGTRTFASIEYGEHVIWGLTHRILLHFLDLVDGAGL